MIEGLLRTYFDCDLKSGKVFWKIDNGTKCRKGMEAGTLRPEGRTIIRLKGHNLYRYRVVWFFATGKMPSEQIDHIDRNCSNDSIYNLRDVSNEVNSWNRGPNLNNKLGIKGVYQSGRRFVANIHIRGKTLYIGTFDTAEEAYAARLQAETI